MATLKSYKKTEFEKLLHPVRNDTLSYEIMAKIYKGSKFIGAGEVYNCCDGVADVYKCYAIKRAFLSSHDAYKAKGMITSDRVDKYRVKFIVVKKGRMDKVIKYNCEHAYIKRG